MKALPQLKRENIRFANNEEKKVYAVDTMMQSDETQQ